MMAIRMIDTRVLKPTGPLPTAIQLEYYLKILLMRC